MRLIQFAPFTTATKYQRVFVDLGHVPLFAGIAVAALHIPVARKILRQVTPGSYAIAASVALVLAAASEAMQVSSPDRSVSVADFLRNVAGAAFGLILHRLFLGGGADANHLQRRSLIAVSILLSVALLIPATWTAAAYAHRSYYWPNIIGSKYRLERVFIAAYQSQLEIVEDPDSAEAGSGALLLRLGDCLDCGVLLQELDDDWSGLSTTCLELTNLGFAPLTLSVRLGDSPMFFRSTLTLHASINVPPDERWTECVALSEFSTVTPRAEQPAAFRSAALLLDGSHTTRKILIHRIWFE